MLSKTMKLGLGLFISALIITGCASNSEEPAPEPTSAPETTVTTTSTPSTTSTIDTTAIVTLGTIFYFDFDQSTLTPETRDLLIAHVNELKSNPRAIRLEGHADERGTREYNMALGERRAVAVRDFLRLQGVNSPIEVISYGEEQPADAASTEAAWSLNRRVELK